MTSDPAPIPRFRDARGNPCDPGALGVLQGDDGSCPWREGMRVSARGATWQITRVVPHGTCTRVDLAAATISGPRARTLLVPFDHLRVVQTATRWRHASLAAAALRVADACGRTTGAGDVASLPPALDVVAWQRTAAEAVCAGAASVLLLADGVGLGKTVQAGLVVAALKQHGAAVRVLIVTPAGLRDQWVAEWSRLFGWDAVRIDPAGLRAIARQIRPDVNPWSLPGIRIASLDFVKQPEVLAAAVQPDWDVVIVDEAHQLAARTERRAAADVLARRARVVLLLTATPHTGDSDDFAALCAVGGLEGDGALPALVRRGRREVGLGGARRVRAARVRLSAVEEHLHRQLRSYAATVWRDAASAAPRLAMTVLLKRASSSAHALACSLQHRLRMLEASGPAAVSHPQLPFDDAGESDAADDGLPAVLGAPGLSDRRREQDFLADLSRLAVAAGGVESKLAWVARLLARTRERAVIFTEYRDTLAQAVRRLGACGPVSILHGGLSRLEREAAASAFAGGRTRLLLATDVASEGLNLQADCRLVISLELPWNPVRLEQRIGRVDRIGQSRRVHAVHVVATATAEEEVLARLHARVHAIRHALGASGNERVLPDESLAAAGLGVGDAGGPRDQPAIAPALQVCATGEPALEDQLADSLRLRAAAIRILQVHRRGHGPPETGGARVTVIGRRRRERLALDPGVLFVVSVCRTTRAGRTAACVLVPVHVQLAGSWRRHAAAALLRALGPLARTRAAAAAEPQLDLLEQRHRAFVHRGLEREQALRRAAGKPVAPAAIQPGLFDRRALIEAARRQADARTQAEAHDARLRLLAADLVIAQRSLCEIAAALVLR